MGIADPEAALEKLREFRALLVRDQGALEGGGTQAAHVQRSELQPLIERIARELDPDGVERLGGRWNNLAQSWTLNGAISATDRLIGILEKREESERIFGSGGPTLAAGGLHPWVWNAAASLWDGGHHGPAVHEAAKAIELQTQLRVGRRDLTGRKLYSTAFSKDDPTASGARLRFSHLDRSERPDDWTSAHEGAMYLGMGCAQGIRNPQAHPSDDISEQEALEQLAALSVLARWVDKCRVVSVSAAGEEK